MPGDCGCNEQCEGNSFLGKIKNLSNIKEMYADIVSKWEEVLGKATEVDECCEEMKIAKVEMLDARDKTLIWRDEVQEDRDVIDALTLENRRIEIHVHDDWTKAELAANRAEAVVIPTEATYSMECIDGMICSMSLLMLENKATNSRIKIEGLN